MWSLALTAPRSEFKVAAALHDRKIDHHLFKIHQLVAHRGKLVEREAAAYPGYIFIRIADGFHLLREQVQGLIDFVRDGMSIWHDDGAVVQSILARADANGFLTVPSPPCRFVQGQRVIVRGDSLIAGYEAKFDRVIGPDLAVVEQLWLGRYVPVRVKLENLDVVLDRRRKKRRHHRSKQRS